jgi:hypothetical protein
MEQQDKGPTSIYDSMTNLELKNLSVEEVQKFLQSHITNGKNWSECSDGEQRLMTIIFERYTNWQEKMQKKRKHMTDAELKAAGPLPENLTQKFPILAARIGKADH